MRSMPPTSVRRRLPSPLPKRKKRAPRDGSTHARDTG
ncbi:hypothetical protein J2T17_004777 [Paenibacillus mucilaginosus]